jgi:hypothetical protein
MGSPSEKRGRPRKRVCRDCNKPITMGYRSNSWQRDSTSDPHAPPIVLLTYYDVHSVNVKFGVHMLAIHQPTLAGEATKPRLTSHQDRKAQNIPRRTHLTGVMLTGSMEPICQVVVRATAANR